MSLEFVRPFAGLAREVVTPRDAVLTSRSEPERFERGRAGATREEALNAAARRHLRDSGVPVEGSKGEWGAGQHELNVRHAEVLAMADRHAIYKQCLKEVAAQLELSVTFMAKVAEDRAGSSCHLNLSLWRDGRNVFAERAEQAPSDGASYPDIFRWFLGGWIAHAPEMMVFYAPTVNSYKRYRSGLMGADGLRLGRRQPHRRLPRRRRGRRPARRVPHPGRRLQPLSGVRGGARLGPGRDREPH